MKTLILGFSSHTGIFAWLIKKVTASHVSHAYIRIPNFHGTDDMVFQASGLAVNYCNYEYFITKTKVVEEYEMQVSDEQYEKAMTLMAKAAGKPYSMREIYGYLYVLFMREYRYKRVENPFGDGDKSYVCSELAAESIGAKDPESMTPEDLRRYCKKTGNLILRSIRPELRAPLP